ncbi:hypothetical protein AZ270_gp62 [Acidianus tailed spindle virus]|uniref:hypothetical protein n=1 Tax=Acidianus tailed spindle virus TaxID=1797140 RepID=UPI00076F32B9|nr:hypothetical protein AZ270_gp62 [Acidianus tailed spindle virus]AME30085.1 hypothetical protein ATSV_D85b [Acidianus tailed spindle virus]
MSQEFVSKDQEGEESISSNLLNADWDYVEELIESFLNDHMRTWNKYSYFVIDSDTMLIKVYGGDEPTFTIKARLVGGKLEVVDVR